MADTSSARPFILIGALFGTAGCAGGGGPYPSLEQRPIERSVNAATVVAPPVSPTAPPPVEPGVDAGVAAQLAAAEASRASFAAEEASARRAVEAARNATIGGEAWVAAQQALSRLDQARGPASTALTNLDETLIATGGAPSPALSDAWTRVSAIAEEQQAALNALAERLPQP